ncbi:hypothetical protein SDC9_130754 [bioreactor metagenome]|uniref:Secretion system C-terminal sorting domain-containing protein n=1 Tax=bioreactor metagenome TaxID=1076179 RepID=A0A645D3F2_9ZZZZ
MKKGTTEYDYESNRDTVMIVNPITLPYYNNFESGMSDFIKDKNNAWQLSNTKSHSGNFSLSNCADTYPISIMTLNWFSIPDTVKNVTMSLFLNTKRVEFDKNIYAYVEITKDKRNWYKLLQIKLDDAKWDHYKFSLNEFIGEPYIEIRFRLNACSSATMRKLYIDDLNINFDAKEIPTPKIVDISREHDSLLTIKWEGINYEDDNTFFYDGKYYFHVGYNIYRNGVKLNSNSINAKQYIDSYDSTKPSSYYCYQVSAIYNVENKDKEGEYSVSRCYDPNSIEEDIHLWELNIAPNPSNHSISIYTGLRNPYTITIFGLDGIKVLQEQYFFDGDIDLSYLPKGTYFLNIVTNNSSVSKRIVIE